MLLHPPFVPTVRQRWVHGWILTFSAFFPFPHFLISHSSFLISSFLLLVWPMQHSCLKGSDRLSLIPCQPCVDEEYEILSDLLELVVFHCQLCRGAEGGEAGWRVAVNEYMHTSFTEASFPYYCMHVVFTVRAGRWFQDSFTELSKTQSPVRPFVDKPALLSCVRSLIDVRHYISQNCATCACLNYDCCWKRLGLMVRFDWRLSPL